MARKRGPVSEYLAAIGAKGGKARAKPTVCPRCGELLRTAREAWVHCRKPRKSTAAKKAAAKKKRP